MEVHFQPHPAREGEEATLTEIIENRKVLPVPMLQVEFLLDRSLGIDEEENASLSDQLYKRDVFSVSFYQKISRTIPLKCRKRGYYHIHEANLIAGGLQMEKNYYKDIPQDTFLYVYPGDVSIDRLKLPMHRLGGVLEGRRGMVEDPFAFAGMREYDGTDPMNRINWKASARSGKPYGKSPEFHIFAPGGLLCGCGGCDDVETYGDSRGSHPSGGVSFAKRPEKKAFPHLFTRTARIFFPAAWFRCRRAAEEARPRRSTVP